MENEIKIGVGIPTYKNPNGLMRCLCSVEHAPIANFYIIDNSIKNLGVAASWNRMILEAISDKIDWLFLLNDDVEVREGCLTKTIKILSHMTQRPPIVSGYTGRYIGHNDGLILNEIYDFCAFALSPLSIKNTIGLFDEQFFPAYFEDCDFAHRAKIANVDIGVLPCFQVNHHNCGTRDCVTHESFNRNKELYIEKWGGAPSEEKK